MSSAGAYYTVNRVPRVLTAKEKKFGAVSSYAGSEVYISLVDAKVAPYQSQLSQLNIVALCTNRHLPIQLPISVGDTDLATELYSPVASIRFVAGPTVPVASTAQGDPSWRIINHLSLNYLSLLDAKEGDGAVALRDLLKLYVNPNDVFTLRQIEGVRSVVATPIVRRVASAGPLTFARGLEIRVIMDEEAFEGSGIFILGAVLAQFFARYVSINSFTETVIVSLTTRGDHAMAEPDRQTSDSLAAEIALRPHEFNFFQAVRRLEAEHAAWPRVGWSDRLEEDYLRFCQIPSLAFAPSSIESVARIGPVIRMYVNFLGMFGPNGPLPQQLTDFARDRLRNAHDPTLVRFMDIFHHRMLVVLLSGLGEQREER